MSGFFYGSLIIGRFSGIHSGHISLIKKAKEEHVDNMIVVGIVVGGKTKYNKKKNPFSFETRQYVMDSILSKMNIKYKIISIPNAYIPDIYKYVLTLGIYINHLYCGSDRVLGYIDQHIDELGIEVIPIERGKLDVDASMISASMMREYILDDNYQAFVKGLNEFNILTQEEVYNIWIRMKEEMANDSTY